MASYLVTSLVLVVPLVFLAVQRRLPFGAATVGVAALAALAATVQNFQRPWVILAAAAGGLVVDAVIAVVSAHASRRAVALAIAGVLPAAVWSAALVALHQSHGVRWSAEMASGVVVLSSLVSVLIVAAAVIADRHRG